MHTRLTGPVRVIAESAFLFGPSQMPWGVIKFYDDVGRLGNSMATLLNLCSPDSRMENIMCMHIVQNLPVVRTAALQMKPKKHTHKDIQNSAHGVCCSY